MPRISVALALACSIAAPAAAQDLYDVDTVRTIEITAPVNWRTLMASNFASKTLIKVDVTFEGKTYKDVGARHRGFSTYHFLPASKQDKRPWKLLFDEYVPDQTIEGYRTLNLNNNIWDPSVIREVAGYEFMRKFLPAPKCSYILVKVNGEDLGLFTNTQQINKDFVQEHYRDDEGTRYRGERASNQTSWNDSALTWLGPGQARYVAAYELKTENGKYPPWTNLIASIDVLNNTAPAQIPSVVPSKIDVDNALRFVAVANMTAWLDSYLGRTCKNFYIYDDPFHGVLRFHPWDLNNGFGGLTDGLGTTGIARMAPFYRENDVQYPRPLFSQLVRIPKWRAAYLAHLRVMAREFDWARMGPRINALRALIRPHLQVDARRIYTMQQFDDAMIRAINVGFVTVPGIQPFFTERNRFHAADAEMSKRAPTLSALAHAPLAPKPTDTVWVTVRVSGVAATEVTLHHRVRGPFVEAPMFDDGQHRDGAANDGVYGASIPAQPAFTVVEYFTSANDDLSRGGAMAILPETGSYGAQRYRVSGSQPTGPIVISEFVAKNETGYRDNNGDRDDWIELLNIGASPVSLGGMYLTDDATMPTRWQIPPNQILPPGGSLVIWADDEAAQGPLHANFKLSASGEEVALFAADGKTNLDWIGFGPQQADVSTGRLPGFLGFPVTFPEPTPAQGNAPLPCGHLRYGSANPQAAGFVLQGVGAPRIPATVDYVVGGAPPSSAGALFAGVAGSLQVPGLGALLLDPLLLLALAPLQTDAAGAGKVSLTIPNLPALGGQSFYFQSVLAGGGGVLLSNAVVTTVCR